MTTSTKHRSTDGQDALSLRYGRSHDAHTTADQSKTSVVPVLWQLQISHYVEKVRWALDYKRIPHIRHSLLPGLHAVKTKRLTGDTSTAPVLTFD
ncbi:MAG: glutathione S-transferase N-terminal domain-containing protein, partial [Solirubrobacterales bacterium]|nr:glutathione S-transferase N-terminal domain-containing protein [Solirubrobacterales bacterium]